MCVNLVLFASLMITDTIIIGILSLAFITMTLIIIIIFIVKSLVAFLFPTIQPMLHILTLSHCNLYKLSLFSTQILNEAQLIHRMIFMSVIVLIY